ncbi:hypothetical protein DENSPDRAFT_886111 [Dentipellis sp. KUC8613]|nr:hypothetical protein DENSPDRAFT_886111 [Dentipellis sp. KUC8613]
MAGMCWHCLSSARRSPVQVYILGALPLRNLSRFWGWINSLELSVWFRPYGFRLYAWTFGCNLDEIEHADLRAYASLGDFFYRRLRPGARPVDPAALVRPADGTVLHFGTITDHRSVEQVKGITYSLDALLGVDCGTDKAVVIDFPARDLEVVDDEEFANVNGIDYTLSQLFGVYSVPVPVAGCFMFKVVRRHTTARIAVIRASTHAKLVRAR